MSTASINDDFAKVKPSAKESASKEKTQTLKSVEDNEQIMATEKKDVIRIETASSKMLKRLPIGLAILFVLLLSLFIYRFILKNTSYINPIDNKNPKISVEVKSEAKDFEDPINGMYFSKEEAAKFKDLKPIAVMVNNYDVARPSLGLSYADIIYEAVAEGGVTRLMPIFHSRIPEKVGSVRSARYYFVELASGYSAHYFHWGAAHVPPCQKADSKSKDYCPPVNGKVETNPDVDAYDRIVELGVPNLDGGNYSTPGGAFDRDSDKIGKVALEHTAFVRLPLALELAKDIRPKESWHVYQAITQWQFKNDAPIEERGDIGSKNPITYNYWDLPAFKVEWMYDKNSNTYLRKQGGVVQKDALNGKELRAKVIAIRFTNQRPVGDKKNHLYFDLVGTGDALIFQDGKVIKGTWARSTHSERDVYVDTEGNPIRFVRGQIWIQLVPKGNIIKNISTPESIEVPAVNTN